MLTLEEHRDTELAHWPDYRSVPKDFAPDPKFQRATDVWAQRIADSLALLREWRAAYQAGALHPAPKHLAAVERLWRNTEETLSQWDAK